MQKNLISLLSTLLLSFFTLIPAFSHASDPSMIPMENGWYEIKTGGDSICARGGEYSFFFFKGKSNKVVIDFIGGGACWNEETCAEGSGIFWDSVDVLRDRVKDGLEGIYDHTQAGNPISEWSHIVIPYCTGDIHWGDSVETYGSGNNSFKIHHKGAVNTRAVLDWVNKNINAPEKILLTGCSAGSYGSIYWTPTIKKNFPSTKVYQLGDGGAGVITQDFIRNNFPRWKAHLNSPNWIPGLDPRQVDWYSLSAPYIYQQVGAFYPDVRLSQFSTAYDATQVFFYELMGGGGDEEWSREMFSHMNSITQKTPNFNYYVGSGENHCIIPYDYFYTVQTQGVSFVNWLENYISDKPVTNVSCVDCQ